MMEVVGFLLSSPECRFGSWCVLISSPYAINLLGQTLGFLPGVVLRYAAVNLWHGCSVRGEKRAKMLLSLLKPYKNWK